MNLVTLLSYLPGPVLRRLIPHVRLADLRYSVESMIAEAWLQESSEPRHILVVGGDPLLHLPLARNGATLVGMATDPRTVEEAHRLARRMGIADRVHFYVSDLLRLPFPAAHFDAVLCGAALARSTDDLFVLREMVRVLKSGGVLGLTLPAFEAAGIVSRHLPHGWLVEELHVPAGVSATGGPLPPPPAPGMTARIQAFLRERQGLRRIYQYSRLSTRLDLLGLEIADHGPYLTRLGAVVYEAFHTLASLDRRNPRGRWLYALLSPLLLGPVLVMDAASQGNEGYGLRIAAVKRSDSGNMPRRSGEGGGLELEWAQERRERSPLVTPG